MKNWTIFFRTMAWAWIIVIGGLLLTPGGIICTVCGSLINQMMGILSIVIGMAGLTVDLRDRFVSG